MPNNPTNNINLFDTYTMLALVEEIAPVPSFFKNRYFPTTEEDIFSTEKVLTEFKDGDYEMAPMVSRRVGDIPVSRDGFAAAEIVPAYIGMSVPLTADDLNKRGFGEALFSNLSAAQRAARLQLMDFNKLDARITRREEWLAVQTMMNNSCTIQEYIDANSAGEEAILRYYEDPDEHKYVIGENWTAETSSAIIIGDIINMCDKLTQRGLPVTDLIVGSDVAPIFRGNKDLRDLFNKQSGVITGTINEVQYPGVVKMASGVNFGGYNLDIFCPNSVYKDASGAMQRYYNPKSIMVTAEGAGSMKYAAVTQKEHGAAPEAWFTRTGKRIPKLILNINDDYQALRLTSRPLPVPKNKTPWISAENVVK